MYIILEERKVCGECFFWYYLGYVFNFDVIWFLTICVIIKLMLKFNEIVVDGFVNEFVYFIFYLFINYYKLLDR